MSGHDHRWASDWHLPPGAALCLVASLALTGCNGWKQAFGIEKTSPDEFAVESRAPLTIPPEFDLRPPAPGAPRPQETSSASRARDAIDTAGPGKPGDQASPYQLRASDSGLPAANGPNPNAVSDNSLSAKLLTYQDAGGGAAVQKRDTQALKDIY